MSKAEESARVQQLIRALEIKEKEIAALKSAKDTTPWPHAVAYPMDTDNNNYGRDPNVGLATGGGKKEKKKKKSFKCGYLSNAIYNADIAPPLDTTYRLGSGSGQDPPGGRKLAEFRVCTAARTYEGHPHWHEKLAEKFCQADTWRSVQSDLGHWYVKDSKNPAHVPDQNTQSNTTMETMFINNNSSTM